MSKSNTTDDKKIESSEKKETVVKEVTKSKRGAVTESKVTRKKAEENKKVQKVKEKPKPFTGVMNFEVLGNLKRNGKTYVKGDVFEDRLSKATQELIDLYVIKQIN